jgi:hypothetical protein
VAKPAKPTLVDRCAKVAVEGVLHAMLEHEFSFFLVPSNAYFASNASPGSLENVLPSSVA